MTPTPDDKFDAAAVSAGIQFLLSAGYTGDAAADYIKTQIVNGDSILRIAAEDTADNLLEKIKTDPDARKNLIDQPGGERNLKVFLAYFVARARELSGIETRTQ